MSFLTNYNTYMRKCYSCLQLKPLDEFSKDKCSKSGRRYICKTCDSRKRMHRFKTNPASRYRKRHKTQLKHQFSKQEWEHSLVYFNHSCAYCGSKDNLTKDHIIPLNKYGTNHIVNIVPACKSCNSSKQDTNLEKWFLDKFRIYNISRLEKIYNYQYEYFRQH